jgi:hypothetical protein
VRCSWSYLISLLIRMRRRASRRCGRERVSHIQPRAHTLNPSLWTRVLSRLRIQARVWIWQGVLCGMMKDCLSDCAHTQQGRGFSLNLPLEAGLSTTQFMHILDCLVPEAARVFRPDVIVWQCGVDGLCHDPCGDWALTPDAYVHAARLLRCLHVPLLVLGGGGYAEADAVRCWSRVMAELVGDVQLSEDIPEHAFFDMYGPSFTRAVASPTRRNRNSDAAVEAALEGLLRHVRALGNAGQREKVD